MIIWHPLQLETVIGAKFNRVKLKLTIKVGYANDIII